MNGKPPPPPGRKPCPFCRTKAPRIDYKDYPLLKGFTDYFGNIKRRYYTGVCLHHQKKLKEAIERARFLGLLPFRK